MRGGPLRPRAGTRCRCTSRRDRARARGPAARACRGSRATTNRARDDSRAPCCARLRRSAGRGSRSATHSRTATSPTCGPSARSFSRATASSSSVRSGVRRVSAGSPCRARCGGRAARLVIARGAFSGIGHVGIGKAERTQDLGLERFHFLRLRRRPRGRSLARGACRGRADARSARERLALLGGFALDDGAAQDQVARDRIVFRFGVGEGQHVRRVVLAAVRAIERAAFVRRRRSARSARRRRRARPGSSARPSRAAAPPCARGTPSRRELQRQRQFRRAAGHRSDVYAHCDAAPRFASVGERGVLSATCAS